MNNPLALLVGAVVWVWMPESENVLVPGPKLRPVLVLEADKDGILVAYGTSQKTDRYGLGEFVIITEEVPGLTKATKISLRKTLRLPVDNAFFTASGKVEVAGTLPARARAKLYRALEEVGYLE